MRSVACLAVALLAAACATTPSADPGRISIGDPTAPPEFRACEPAFRAWVEVAVRLNRPDADLGDLLQRGESLQAAVFDQCTLAEAERLNAQIPIEYVPGVPEPMIKPDFRTFAEVECIDESPLLDGTALCAEVGR